MKIADILGGTHKRRKRRGSRIKRIRGRSLFKEGGNIFPDTISFDHKMIPGIMKSINGVLAKANAQAIPIGSGATPTPGKVSGDLDMIVDQDQLAQHFDQTDPKVIRKKLRQLFDLAGLETGQSGVSVHVKVPMDDHAHQVDIMVVPNAERASKFHTHSIPKGSKFKGVNKMIALAWLAKQKNMLFSPYQGLFSRDQAGKKDKFITQDIDEVARSLLGPNASGKDIGSVEAIMAALGKEAGDAMLADLRSDPNWKELD